MVCSIVLFSCLKQVNEPEKPGSISTTRDSISNQKEDPQQKVVFYYDTTIIASKVFVASHSNFRNLIVVNEDHDTVFTHFDWIDGIEFIDFDGDGNNDLLLNYLTNVPDIHDLALYNEKTKRFQIVEKFSNFPAPQKIEGTKYFYSYHRSGCADSDWESDLFLIKDFLATRIGNIYGSGCEGNDKNGIFVSRVRGEKEKLIQEFIRGPGYYDDKFAFIKEYWNRNYKLFE